MAPDVAFVIGAPRSGTTWLQHMLGAHPAIATTQETDLFDCYLAPWYARWHIQLPPSEAAWRANRFKGLPAVLDEPGLDALVRMVVDHVHDAMLALKPGATLVLEKVPGYALQAGHLSRVVPEAAFVHLVRDGRDAAVSLQRAARGWGQHFWPSSSIRAAAEVWRNHVAGARALDTPGVRYREIRYEELRSARGPALLADLFDLLGLQGGLPLATEIYERFSISRARDPHTAPSSLVWGGEVRARLEGEPVEPEGFIGEGGSGGWRDRLSIHDQVIFDRVAGRLLCELGYADPDWVECSAFRRAAALAPLWARRRLSPLDYHLRRRWTG